MKWKTASGLAWRLLKTLAIGLASAAMVLIALGVSALNSRPDLKPWHTAHLEEEFRADSGLTRFADYLELENRLFAELDRKVYQRIDPVDRRMINRYFAGSLSDPGRWSVNWNRSFELPAAEPRAGVLLLHGMSDSPYSLRSIGEALHARGAWVTGLRLPGHGQAPSGLLRVTLEDMMAAVRLAAEHVSERSSGRPFYIVGYSNGGALGVLYALQALDDPALPRVSGLILLSPEIGISPLAALAVWQERLGHVLGLEKLAWTDLLPEYDPWKYNSFALNAGKQAHRATQEIQRQVSARGSGGSLGRLPPILAFQSVVDATVTAPALVEHLFGHLPAPAAASPDHAASRQHELVLFDIDRFREIEPLLAENPSAWMDPMLADQRLKFRLTLVSSYKEPDRRVRAITRMPGSGRESVCKTGLQWPPDVYSLSHVALPFPPDDPTYGRESTPPMAHGSIRLGEVALRGERGVLELPAAAMLRLRWNPFHGYLMERLLAFMDFPGLPQVICSAE